MTDSAVFHDSGDDTFRDAEGPITDFPTSGTGVVYGTPAVVLGTAAAAGSIDEAIRRDSTVVAFDATSPSTQAFGDAAAVGTAGVAARRDHKHAMPATPTSVSGNAGTATALQTGRTIDGQTFDGTANITVIAPGTHAATGKTTPVDADELPLVDSAASNVLKKLTWANLKATLKTYFDTLYAATGSVVTSINKTGSTALTGAVTLTGGTNVTLTQSGQDISIAASGGGGGTTIGRTQLVYRYTVTGSDKASIDTGADTADAGDNDWTGGDVLEVYFIGRTDEAGAAVNIDITVNNDTNAKYDLQYELGVSTGVSAATSLAQTKWNIAVDGSGNTAGYASTMAFSFPGYARTVFNKEGVCLNGYSGASAGNNRVGAYKLGFADTSALTRMKFAAQGAAKFKVGTQLLVYKRLAS